MTPCTEITPFMILAFGLGVCVGAAVLFGLLRLAGLVK